MSGEHLHGEGSAILKKIKEGDRKFLQEIYEQNRESFGMWAKRHYDVQEEVVADIYQKSFVALYYNIREGRLQNLKSSLKTYLFSIGKNMLREHFKDRFIGMIDINDEIIAGQIDESVMDKYDHAYAKDLAAKLLEKIGEPCKTVISLFYFQHFSTEAIAERMGYKNRSIAAKRKFICLQQLRAMMDQLEGI